MTGQNVAVEYNFAELQYELLSARASDLVVQRVAAIVATGGSLPRRAAKAATTRFQSFAGGEDPVKDGLVASLDRPGGNVTGIMVTTH